MTQAKKKVSKKKEPEMILPPCKWKNCTWTEIPTDPYYPTRAFKCSQCLTIQYKHYN